MCYIIVKIMNCPTKYVEHRMARLKLEQILNFTEFHRKNSVTDIYGS